MSHFVLIKPETSPQENRLVIPTWAATVNPAAARPEPPLLAACARSLYRCIFRTPPFVAYPVSPAYSSQSIALSVPSIIHTTSPRTMATLHAA